ncbi:glycosyltransferase family 2 protein [Flavobacterium foetidum]|uniref:glycosyltransferase family 2 protein n=1 Tax=Flavobacterium foetidum TaxID=2026681 RepID=UPI0013C2F1C6|nr:glycosyltransferase family A protein [Flavobacterium foetidum]KAF2516509.1 glycosyltransferase family 2 protein [Flavobacterium foetidum]
MSNVLTENDLEILIATKDRSSLDFLERMFPFEHFSNFHLIIINQSQESTLVSDFEKVKVFNSKEKGLSKSRNLAIKNASKKICLITDDDVVFESRFEKVVLEAFAEHDKASIITFNHRRSGSETSEKKESRSFRHDLNSIWKVSSIEIAFRLDEIRKKKICFDERFGLGSFFETAEEFLFLRSALEQKMEIFFYPKLIVSHPQESSGRNEGSDQLLFARTALFYKLKGNYAYIWLLKYLFFLYRNHFINSSDFKEKFKTGLAGIQKYQELIKRK